MASNDNFAALKADYDKLVAENETLRGENHALRDTLSQVTSEDGERQPQKAATEQRVLEALESQISAVPMADPAAGGAAANQNPQIRSNHHDSRILDIVRDGLMQGRVDLFLQPIVKLPQRTPRFYECYSRIRSADGAMVMPAQYIGLAKEHGLLSSIDNMLLFRCVQLVRKAQRHNHNLGFFCNISVQSMSDRNFFRKFIAFMEENVNLASRLTFELAEEDVDSHWKMVADDLDRLASLGFRFSMDRVNQMDFDPSLMASRHFKFVKVDVGTILNYSHVGGNELKVLKQNLDRNGIDLIVEKVETQEQFVELLDLGIYFAQGFFFGEPRLSRKE